MKTTATSALISLLLCYTSALSAAPSYSIAPVGLADLEHTRNDGFKFSGVGNPTDSGDPIQFNDAGNVAGYSWRYNGGSTSLGYSAWLYNGATTINIGLVDNEHTQDDGSKFSQAYELNAAGQVRGSSTRYNGGSTSLGSSAWLYDGASTINIGLAGSEYTRSDGYKSSGTYKLNNAGDVSGFADRYNGSDPLGMSVWFYDGSSTVVIGLTGSEHTRADGYKYSTAFELNEAGQVTGGSDRFNGGGIDLGRTAWLFNGASTIAIGLTGPEHTGLNDTKYSFVSDLNEAGKVSGFSTRYNGGLTPVGTTAWIYNGTTTNPIGLTGPEHTRNDGFQSSGAGNLNASGQVAGGSSRFNGGSADLGVSAWIFNGTTTIPIGLTGPEHTRNDGYKYNEADSSAINNAGQVMGRAYRFNGGSVDLGRSAWLYNGTTTVNIGLAGTEHTRNDGYKMSFAQQMNEAGQVRGISRRYNGSVFDLGQSAWLYNGTSTVNIGLTGPEHTTAFGYKSSTSTMLNESGQAIGYSQLYSGDTTGRSAWLFNGTTTIDIGLTDATHTRGDGYKSSDAGLLNNAGQVIGSSDRFNGGSSPLGSDAWFYDPTLNQTFSLQLSTRSDGYADSYPAYLGEDGLTLGTYALYDASDNYLGNRAFYFTVAGGLHDLGSLVGGGLAASGWDHLADTIRANGHAQILGHGNLTTQPDGQMLYLLTPAIPLPGDYNADGTVNAADYVVWRKTNGTPAAYDTWRAHFGQTAGSGAGTIASAAVPEPATLLLIFAAVGWRLRQGRAASKGNASGSSPF